MLRFSLFKSSFHQATNLWRTAHSLYPLTVRQVFEQKPIDQSITLIGYLWNTRKLKTQLFLDLADGSSVNTQKHLQVVASIDEHSNLAQFRPGCSVTVKGKFVRSTHPKQEYELLAEKIDLINSCDPKEYPISPRTPQTLLQLRPIEHLRLRSPLAQVIFRLRSQMMFSIYEYFQRHQFVQIQTPCLTQNDCEGGGETFQIQPYQSRTTGKDKQYFDRPVYLTVSGQLHLETAAK